jgi:hypothetical protein
LSEESRHVCAQSDGRHTGWSNDPLVRAWLRDR